MLQVIYSLPKKHRMKKKKKKEKQAAREEEARSTSEPPEMQMMHESDRTTRMGTPDSTERGCHAKVKQKVTFDGAGG